MSTCTCGHDKSIHGRRDAQTAWQSFCYGDVDCECEDFTPAPPVTDTEAGRDA